MQIKNILDECVPKKVLKERRNQRNINMNLPMNRKLWSKIKRKQRLWGRLKTMKEGNRVNAEANMCTEVEREYRRLNNQVRSETRKAVKLKEKEIARNCKDNPKMFWKYVQSKTKNKVTVSELYTDENKTHKTTTDQEKAEVLLKQFSGDSIRNNRRNAAVIRN